MEALFLKVLNMSLAASWPILAAGILRLVLKNAPKWVNVLFWSIAAIRLICPLTIESPVSLMPNSIGNGGLVSGWTDDYIGDIDIYHPGSIHYDAAIGAGREPVSDGEGGYYVVTKHDQLDEPDTIENTVIPVLSAVWLTGVGAMFLYAAVSYMQLRKKVGASILVQDRIWICDDIQTPFILGVFKPRIYVPSGMDAAQFPHILAHENAHLKRHDHWWKPLGYLVLAVHWFNPLVWAAYILFCRDIELACDEKVICELNQCDSLSYSEALLSCSVNRTTAVVCPLAFGEVGVKERVKRVLNYKKPAFWIVVVAVIACIALAVSFLTNPKGERAFAIKGQNVSDLNTEEIINKIANAENLDDGSLLYVHADNFDQMLTADFNWANDGAIRFFYAQRGKTYSAQLRMFHEDNKYFITERSQWFGQNQSFKLFHYLDALKYMPQEDIRKLSPDADGYSVMQAQDGVPGDYARVLQYSQNGVESIDGWHIHLMVQPLHQKDDGSYNGSGDELIHLFYGTAPAASDLDTAISFAIMEHNKDRYYKGVFTCESHIVLATEAVEPASAGQIETLTVYALALYEEYNLSEEGIQSVSGGCIPVALTFHVTENGYALSEYWEPGDGADYSDDIRDKFPEDVLDTIWNPQNHVDALKAENQQKALEFSAQKGDFDELVNRLLTIICSEPAASSNPGAYIQANRAQYDELLRYGDSTLKFCFTQFLAGGQTDLRGHIMASLCKDRMQEMGESVLMVDSEGLTGQDWFDAFRANAKRLESQYSKEDLEKDYPASWLLLQMIKE